MASINDILSSLFNAARETGKGTGVRSELIMGTTGEAQSFEDVLAQMAAEDGAVETANSSASFGGGVFSLESENEVAGILPKPSADVSGSLFKSLVSIAEVDVRVSETIKFVGSNPLEQMTQALSSLTSGLGELMRLISQFRTQDQAQAGQALVSLTGASERDVKELLSSVGDMMEGVPVSQNPLLATQSQQNVLLGQWVQEMIQSGQMLFGNLLSQVPPFESGLPLNPVILKDSTHSEFGLQISYSETDIAAVQMSAGQVSQVFISLQTFQMSATFVQSGSQFESSVSNSKGDPALVQNQSQVFQPIAVPDLSRLTTQLNLPVSLPVISPEQFAAGLKPVSTDEDGLRQNLRQLVQLLVSFGVSRAALTSFMGRESDNAGTGTRGMALQENPLRPQVLPPLMALEAPETIVKTPNFSPNPSVIPFLVDLPSHDLGVSQLASAQLTSAALVQVRSSAISASWLNVVAQTFENQGLSALISSAVAQVSGHQGVALASFSSEALVVPAGLGTQVSSVSERQNPPLTIVSALSALEIDANIPGSSPLLQSESFPANNPALLTFETKRVQSSPQASTQNAPIAVMAGETLKVSPIASILENNDPSNALTAPGGSASGEIRPILPLAVTAVATVSNSLSLKVSDNLSSEDLFDSIKQPLNSGAAPMGQLFTSEAAKGDTAQASGNGGQKLEIPGVWEMVSTQIKTHSSELKAFSRLSIQLIPESLGRVTVQIALVDSAISAKIFVATPEVRETLQNHMVDLKASLSQAGLQIDQLQVQVQGGSSNLLAQYYQYQQEGYGNALPSWAPAESLESLENLENAGSLTNLSSRVSLVDLLV